MNDARLSIILDAKNNASPAIKQTTTDLRDLNKAAGSVAQGLGGIGAMAGVAGILALGTAAVGVTAHLVALAAECIFEIATNGNLIFDNRNTSWHLSPR